MARNPVVAVLLALCIAGAAAAKDESFFADILASSRVNKVRTAGSGGYDYVKTELSCLSQMNFKSCRYTGCPTCLFGYTGGGDSETTGEDGVLPLPVFGFTNVGFQTDFACCPKDLSYGYDPNQDVGEVGYSDKVATCDWEVSIYRWPASLGVSTGNGVATDITPVLTDDGNAVKFGTAWGTCYLNAEAESCDHPLCERMAINVQGGIYVARAYGDSSQKTKPTYVETCNNDAPNLPGYEITIPPGFPGGPDGAAKTPAAGAKQGAKRAEPQPPQTLFSFLLEGLVDIGGKILDCGSGPLFPPAGGNGGEKSQKAAKKATAEIKSAEEYEYGTRQLYPGCALIISGPFSVTSKHDDKIAESGLFEFAPIFDPNKNAEPVYEPTERWPMVRAKGAKIRFTKEEEGKYDSYYRETDREYRDPARDDSYRGYYENKKEKPNRQ